MRNLRFYGSAAVLAMAGTTQGALAQTASPQAVNIEDIIVTAQKREQSVQDVPISLVAVGEEQLAKTGAVSLDDVQRLAPGINISTVGSGFVSYTYIRGAGTNVIDSGADPSVAFFVDEVYQAGTAGLQGDLLDVQRVEVLKGPQGTLFGRNAAAGAVSIITNKPSADFDAWASGDVGNYGLLAVRAGLTGPLSEDGKWRFRAAGSHRQRNAFTNNPAGRDPGDVDSYAGRAQLEYAGDAVTALISVDHYRANNGMTNQFLASAIPFGLISAAAAAALPTDQSFYRRYYDVDGYEDQRTTGVTGRLEWDLGAVTLTSISGYRHNDFRRLADQDGTSADSLAISTTERDESFSQEVRLSGDTDRINWVLGGFYYKVDTHRRDYLPIGPAFPIPALAGLDGDYGFRLNTESFAAFGQASYNLTDQLTVTVGGRYTHDRKIANYDVDPFGPAGVYTVALRPDWGSFDPAAAIEFKPNRDILLYASYRRGFKSGGFQSLPASAALASNVYDPEQVEAFEAGFKSQLLDRRLTFNLALFQSNITDQQILRVPSAGVTIVDNAGRTRARGADFTISVVPTDGLRFDLSGTLQKAAFRRYLSGGVSFAGNRQLRSPDVTLYFVAEYTVPLGERSGSLSFRTDTSYQSKTFFDAANTSAYGTYQPGYALVNGRISYTSQDRHWDASIFAKNITGKHYFRNIALSGPTGLGVPGDPFTFGVSLGWRLK